MDDHQTYCGDHFMTLVGQIVVLCTLNLDSMVCQLCLRVIARKKKKERIRKWWILSSTTFIFNIKYFIVSLYNLTFNNGCELWRQNKTLCSFFRQEGVLPGRKIKEVSFQGYLPLLSSSLNGYLIVSSKNSENKIQSM